MEKEKKKGKLFVMSSAAAYLPFPFLGCYTSSKAAITMLCKTIKKELGAYKTGFNQVMIDNKNKYLEEESIFYQEKNQINRLQRNLFRLIEKDNPSDLVEKIVQEIESPHPSFRIRRPKILNFFLKIYFLFFY